MKLQSILKRFFRRRVQLAIFGGLSAIGLVATVALTLQVFLKLDEYGSTSNDNIQWTMTRLEVDHLKLVRAAEQASMPNSTELQNLRKRFDILYSRTETLKNSRTYQEALTGRQAPADLEKITEALKRLVTLIDLDDKDLLAEKPFILATLGELTQPIRNLSTASISIDAARTDEERAALTSKLIELTVLSILMLAALLSLLALFWRLYRLYRRRALENRITLNRLATILNTSQDAVLVVKKSGRIIDTNAAARTMFGLEGCEDRPATVSDILLRKAEGGRITALAGEKLAESCAFGPNRCANLMARDLAGHTFPVELSADMATRGGDDVCVCFIRDISRRAAAEAEIRKSRDKALEGERAKARFLGMISHEMRTPLHGVLGTLDLMEETSLTEEQSKYARIMKSSGQLLLNQINDALDITQADSGELTLNNARFDLDELLDELIETQQQLALTQNSILQRQSNTARIGMVTGDRDRMHQILLNLISNAVKFTHGGQITIEAYRQTNPKGHSDQVEIQIADTGIGIDEKDLSRIFEDFVRLDDAPQTEGTGLGLGIARQLAILMGGDIGAESIKGEGSIFWVKVPLPAASEEKTKINEEHVASLPSRQLDVLVVEDNANNRYVVEAMLKKEGHRITLASNGAEGVAAAMNQKFDLILMDLSMPELDGESAVKQIRASSGLSAHSRIFALTAHFRSDLDQRLTSAGFDGVHTKPLRLHDLRKLLGNCPSAFHQPSVDMDTTALEQLSALLPDASLNSLIDGFMNEGRAFIDDLPMLKSDTPDRLANRLHRFAGTSATLGAVTLQLRLCCAEAAALEGNMDAASKELNNLPMIWRATLAAVDKRRPAS